MAGAKEELEVRTVVMTGGTTGIGREAARLIANTQGIRLLQGAHNATVTHGEALPLDLALLASVRTFAQEVNDKLGSSLIDALVLNAGTQFGNLKQRTRDGFETMFAVNHLAHYLLLRLLLPKLAKAATVVITTSDAHDPKVNPFGPKTLNTAELAHPRGESKKGFGAGFRAYSASKLCNLLTARALAESEEAARLELTVIAYNPGFTPGTSLLRGWPFWVRLLMGITTLVRPIMSLATIEQAGEELAELALGRIKPPNGKVYASLVKRRLIWPDPSALAQQDDVMKNLWRDSAAMAGLSG